MYNQRQIVSRNAPRIAIGGTGRLRSAEIINEVRARRLGIGPAPRIGIGRQHGIGNAPVCPTALSGPPNCAPPLNVCPENQKRFYLPFILVSGFSNPVAAGALIQMQAEVQDLFMPDRLMVESTIAPFFDITNVIVGNKPQSLAQGSVAAGIFSEVSTYTEMSFDQAYPGIKIIVEARNKSSVPQTFQVQLIGWTAR